MEQTKATPFSAEAKSKLKSKASWFAISSVLGSAFLSVAMGAVDLSNDGRGNTEQVVRDNVASSFHTVYMPLTEKLTFQEIKDLGATNEAVGIFAGCLQKQWSASAQEVTLENNVFVTPQTNVSLNEDSLYDCFESGNLDAALARYENASAGQNQAAAFYGMAGVAAFVVAATQGFGGGKTLVGESALWLRNRRDQKSAPAPEPEAPSA